MGRLRGLIMVKTNVLHTVQVYITLLTTADRATNALNIS